MEPSCTTLCVIFLISSGLFIQGYGWMCPTNSTSVFVREIHQAVLHFYVDISSPTLITYKIWSSTNVNLLIASYINGSGYGLPIVNGTYCTSIGSIDAGNLNINLTVGNKAGVYRLEKSPGVTIEKCITVYILGKPTLPSISEVKDRLIGENLTVTCNSTSTTTPTNHSLSIGYDWMVNSVENPTDSRFTYSSLKQTLTITNITKQDFGKQLTCTATEQVDNGYISDRSGIENVSVIYGPDPCKDLKLLYDYMEGKNELDIDCSAACYPSCVYDWTRNGGRVGATGILSLRNISRYQAGNYSFTARNTAPSYNISFQWSFQVVVKYAPVVTITFSTTDRSESSNLTLYCTGEGVPETYVHTGFIQTVGDVAIPNNNTALGGTVNYSFIHFPSLRLQDTGNYTCKINNGIKDLKGNLDQVNRTEILVKIKPKVLQSNLLFAGAAGGSVLVQVPFYCYPPVTSVKFTWQNGTEIKNSSKYNITQVGCTVNDTFYGKRVMLSGFLANMTISNLKEEDFVNYTLKLENSEGPTSVTIFVTAESIPSPPKTFDYLSVYGRPKFVWEKGFNGGHLQTFVIQTSVPGNDNWETRISISENDEQYRLNSTFYLADIIGLKPGTYTARLIAENIVGAANPVNLKASFTIEEDISGNRSQAVAAAVAGAVSALVFIMVVGVAICLWKRRAEKNVNKGNQLDRNKHGKTVQKDNSDEDVEVDNPMYVSAEIKDQGDGNVYAKPNTKQKSIPRSVDVHAGDDKSKAANRKKQGKQTATERSAEGDIYDNSPTKIEDQTTYGNTAFGDTTLETTDDSTSQTNKGDMNKDGLEYVELAFARLSKGKKPATIGLAERTPYAQVDFKKRADPLPDSD